MDTIIGWLASIAAVLLITGAIYTLLWSQPQVLENWKIKWSLLAGGGLIGLVLITSSFNALFGTSHDGATTAEPRSWYRIKPSPSDAEVRSGLTYWRLRFRALRPTCRCHRQPDSTATVRGGGRDIAAATTASGVLGSASPSRQQLPAPAA